MTLYLLCFLLMLVGLYGVITKRDIIKIILSVSIMGYASNLFLILFAYRNNALYPIITQHSSGAAMVDPLPIRLLT